MTADTDAIRILYVDDSSSFADTAVTCLERENDRFEIETVTAAATALDRFDASSFDCVVSDYEMPGQNGIEFLSAVRERDEEFPFILFTGKGSEEVASDAISAGVTDYLQKQAGLEVYTLLANRIENAVQQYRATQVAAETRAQLHEIANKANDVLWLFTADWEELLFVNGAYETIWGQSRTRLREDPTAFLEAIHPEDREHTREAMARLAAGEAQEIEVRVNADDDFERRVWIQAEPIFDDDGDVVRLVGFGRDVTERTARERELERIRDFFTEAERLGDLGAWEFDESGDVVWTQGTRRIFDVEDSFEPTVDNTLAFFHEEDRETIRAAVDDALDNGEPYDLQARLTTATGEERWVRVRGEPTETPDGSTLVRGYTQDITKQKETEEALRDAKTQLESAIDAGAVGAWEWDIQNDRVVAGTAFAETFGVDPEAAAAGVPLERFVSNIHEEDRPRVEEKIQAAVEHCADYEAEYRVWDADGNCRWVLARGRVECDEAGTPLTFPGTVTDITARKQTELELERHKAFLEESTDIVTVLDEMGTITYASSSAEHILGYDPATLEGTDGFDLIHPADRDDIWKSFVKLRQGTVETQQVTGRFRTATDDWRWLEIRSTNQLDDPAIEGVVSNLRDITDRKREEEKRQLTIERMTDGIIQLDGEWRFTEVNRQAERMLEMDAADLLGESFWDVFDDAVDTRFYEIYHEVMETGDATSFEEYYEGLDAWFEVHVYPSVDEGLSIYFRDVTERKEREQRLQRQHDRMEEFVNVVSHDLRNPLEVAMTRTELLQDEAESEHLHAIETAHHRMESLLEDLLVLARDDQPALDQQQVSLGTVLDRSIDHVRTQELTVDIVDETTLAADPSRLQQLFENLIRNVTEHCGAEATITVGTLPDGFYVEDDGPGIPEAERRRVFEAGYSTADDGTGYGLHIVQMIADAHDWRVEITASEAGGARFEFRAAESASN